MNKKSLNEFAEKAYYSIDDLLFLVKILRDKDWGCDWDKVQTHTSIRHNLIEEAYEVLDAVDAKQPAMLCEELGDVLLQVCLHTEMETETGGFDFNVVCDGICKKLVYRHPHVFSDVSVNGSDEVLANWEQLKKTEKGQISLCDSIEGIARSLPSLIYVKKLQKLISYNNDSYVAAHSELDKLADEPENKNDSYIQYGRLLYEVVNIGRCLRIDPEVCLMDTAKQVIRETNSLGKDK